MYSITFVVFIENTQNPSKKKTYLPRARLLGVVSVAGALLDFRTASVKDTALGYRVGSGVMLLHPV